MLLRLSQLVSLRRRFLWMGGHTHTSESCWCFYILITNLTQWKSPLQAWWLCLFGLTNILTTEISGNIKIILWFITACEECMFRRFVKRCVFSNHLNQCRHPEDGRSKFPRNKTWTRAYCSAGCTKWTNSLWKRTKKYISKS